MTADMAFEGLILSRDAGLFTVVDRLLRQLSISTSVCFSTAKASGQFKDGKTDLLIIDCDVEDWSPLLETVWKTKTSQKPTVVAVTSIDRRVPGAHIVVRKPITNEVGAMYLKAAYQRMLHDYRQYARFALMTPVIAADDIQRSLAITITDIGERGIGISSKEQISVGTQLKFNLRLPAVSREISVEARVLWTREYGRCGGEFIRIPPVDVMILRAWLKDRIRIKKPLVEA